MQVSTQISALAINMQNERNSDDGYGVPAQENQSQTSHGNSPQLLTLEQMEAQIISEHSFQPELYRTSLNVDDGQSNEEDIIPTTTTSGPHRIDSIVDENSSDNFQQPVLEMNQDLIGGLDGNSITR